MDKKEILALINENPRCFLATADEGFPHVRGIHLYRADENGIVFHTGKFKDLYQQLCNNPAVEICFTNKDMQNFIQVRVNGIVEPLEEAELKEQIVADRDYLQPWVEKAGYDGLAVFRLNNGRATVWTMATNFAKKEWIKL